jgi:leukotriene-A4 hydrolase
VFVPRRKSLVLGFSLALVACKPAEPTPSQAQQPMTTPQTDDPDQPVAAEHGNEPGAAMLAAGPDPHSYSRPEQVRVAHVGFNWVVDFDAATLTGDVVLLLERTDPNAPLLLDSRDFDLKHVFTGKLDASPGERGVPELATDAIRNDASWTAAAFTIGERNRSFGAPISVVLPAGANAVKLTYATRPDATGLQWLEPSQTAGKRAPFLYSQSQAIHARSWIPAQDSPGVRTTWDAIVEVDEGFTAVMAADQLGELPRADGSKTRAFRFVMPQPVPAYLVALAVGELERRELGPRTAVWADPAVVEVAAREFADMESMLSSAEALYGAYAWGRYDVLVLPPAFPFGGMENPRLTFATPTLLAGDRSLVAVIAHELAHSWSGNLVTNKTWGDLWLNEGFTVYFERRIVEAIYGPERATIEAVIGKRELLAELRDPELLGNKPEFQKLSQDLRGIDPDESFSGVPYEKGALLLGALERAYGREVFDQFLRDWFTTHAFGTVATRDFLEFVDAQLVGKHPIVDGAKLPDLGAWIEGTGLPDDAPEPRAEVLDAVEADAKAFAAGERKARQLNTRGWTPWHWLHFLRSLPAELTAEQMAQLDEAFALTDSGNAEILGEWLELAARCRYEPAYGRLESFLIEVGRRKFLMPIYRALATTDEGRKQAKTIYGKARPGYHAISRGSIDELLRVE